MAASAILWSLSSIYSQIILLVKRTKIIGMVTLIGALVNFTLNLVFIPYFGIIGAAYSTIISFGFLVVGKMYFSRKFIRFHQDYRFIIKVFAASIIMAIFLYSIRYTITITVFLLFGLIGFGIVLYFGLIFLMKGIDRDMIGQILHTIKR
jgi:O-antigen/teichoic acid export membrane protein